MSRRILILGVAILGCIAGDGFSQETTAAIYGKGVHAYFSGDFEGALDYFNATIRQGTRDPRCWYFRGLTMLRLGREEEAAEDFEQGAKSELAATYQVYRVGKALERVQGSDRLILEQHRNEARLAAYEKAERVRRARYEAFKNQTELLLPEEDDAVPFGAGVMRAESTQPQPAATQTQPAATESQPAAPETPPATVPGTSPAAPAAAESDAVPAEDNPFADPDSPTPPAESADPSDDPFGAPTPVVPTPAAPTEEPPAPAGDDPFGAPAPAAETPAPAGDDPFGAPAASTEEPPAPAGDDPFGAPAEDGPNE